MVFSSTVFLFLFLPALLLVYYLPVGQRGGAGRRGWRNGVLLLFSIGFYAWGEPVFVFLMLASVLVNWLLVLLMSRSRRKKPWMVAAIFFDVVLLGVFKYVSFLSRNLAAITGNDAVIVNIALPIGISFFTFQMMSYVFDVYYGKAQMQRNPLYVALYITLFPQLIAGPIVRYTEVEADILGRRESFAEFSQGLQRFIYGLGKKVLLANFLAQMADNVFDYLEQPSVLMAWIGALAYTFQLYFDFSGYSDMAIGLGQMFGFHFSENFNYPHISKSFTEFWRRFHISLNTWFRDYVYIPPGRKPRFPQAVGTECIHSLVANWYLAWSQLDIRCVGIILLRRFDVRKIHRFSSKDWQSSSTLYHADPHFNLRYFPLHHNPGWFFIYRAHVRHWGQRALGSLCHSVH